MRRARSGTGPLLAAGTRHQNRQQAGQPPASGLARDAAPDRARRAEECLTENASTNAAISLLDLRQIARPQLRHNLLRRLPRLLELSRRKRNRADASVSASAVALANLGQVHRRLDRGPRIRSHRHFRPEAALAQSHAVNAARIQVVRDKLVVALKFVIGDVEEDRAVLALGALAQDLDRLAMPLHQRRNSLCNLRRSR